MNREEQATKKARYLKNGAKIILIILLVDFVQQLIAIYQTRFRLESPLVPESTIWEINKQFIFHAFVLAIAGIIGLLLYFFNKYILVMIIAILTLVLNYCIPV